MPLPKTHRQCVSLLVLRPGEKAKTLEILLVHKDRNNDSWQLPQGGIEDGETIEEAGARELLEETNIHVSPLALHKTRFRYVYDYPVGFVRAMKPAYRGQKLTVSVVFVARETLVTVDMREIDKFLWIQPSALKTYLKRKEYREVVEKAFKAATGEHSKK